MRKPITSVLVAAGLLSWVVAASAWWQSVAQISVGGAPAAYTGPGDAPTGAGTAVAAYSVRAWTSALRGNAVMNVCNTTGGVEVACVNFLSDASTGDLVISSIGGLACATLASNCTVKTWYDQIAGNACSSSTCDLTNATISQRPVLNTSCVGGKPCLTCTIAATTNLVSGTNITTVNQPFTTTDVSNRNSGTTQGDIFSFGGIEIYYAGANLKGMYAGTAQTQAATDANWYATQSVFNGNAGASNLFLNGTANAKSPGTTGATGARIRLCGVNSQNALITEGAIWSGNFSVTGGGQADLLNTNQRAYYGF